MKIFHINNIHNHPIAKVYPKRTRNTLSTDDQEIIYNRTMKGGSAADIRNENERIGRCSKDVLYNQRRKAIEKLKNDNPKELQNLDITIGSLNYILRTTNLIPCFIYMLFIYRLLKCHIHVLSFSLMIQVVPIIITNFALL